MMDRLKKVFEEIQGDSLDEKASPLIRQRRNLQSRIRRLRARKSRLMSSGFRSNTQVVRGVEAQIRDAQQRLAAMRRNVRRVRIRRK